MNTQINIFEVLYPKYKITKPIRLIEFFAGYGSQALALKYLGVTFEHWRICEWAVKSIQAYKDIHFTNNQKDYSKQFTEKEIKAFLHKKGISSNYNELMSEEQIKRLNEKRARTIFNNIFSTHNLVNIQQVKANDLGIIDKDKYEYILTYSFPCQDLSNAGVRKGMSDTSTRSGMLWEVERILTECKELDTLPQILLMENVPAIHDTNNVADFNKWQLRLEQFGYKNYFQDLMATDYEIPQTRNRCFMVSILGDYSYTFPKPIPLKLKLKDLLEDNVDEKYYLSDKIINFFTKNEEQQKEKGNGFRFNVSNGNVIAKTITTRAGSRMDDNFIKIKNADTIKIYTTNKSLKQTLEQNEIKDTCYIDTYNKRIDEEKSGTITTGVNFRNNTFLAENVSKRKKISNELIKNNQVKENDVLLTNFISRRIKENDFVQNNNISPTLDTSCDNLSVCVETYQYAKSDTFMQGKDRLQYIGKETSDTIQTTPKEAVVNSDLRIRKLTPKECFRLMGVKDEDFDKVAKNQSNASLYHLAGDSIVVNVLMAIFKELF